MGKSKKRKEGSRKVSTPPAASIKKTTSITSNSTQFPLAFPEHLPRPSRDFLRNQNPYKVSFEAALDTSYEGFAVDDRSIVNEEEIQQALDNLRSQGLFRTDVTQPFGLGTKLAKTYVTRCLVGDTGTTYKYLGLRMFAHSWKDNRSESLSTIQKLKTTMETRTDHHLKCLDKKRKNRAGPPVKGRSGFDICLINRMEPSPNLKSEPSLGKGKSSVAWHADSSLEHYSTIAVYHTIVNSDPKCEQEAEHREWSVALRVAHNAEGPSANRRGTDMQSSVVSETPPLAVSLPSGSTYYLLDDFNHHHQHTVLTTGGDPRKAGIRYSCTYRLLRESHNVNYVIERCKALCGNFHKKGSKTWRSEQMFLTELESEWLRQFYIQGQQHRDLLWPYWAEPIQSLLRYWGQLEARTFQTVRFFREAAEGKSEKATIDKNASKTERKTRDRRIKAVAKMEELLEREGQASVESMYDSFAKLLEERAEMRDLWNKRENDHVFHSMEQDQRPLPLPVVFDVPESSKAINGLFSSQMRGSPEELHDTANSLRTLGKAFASGKRSDLPVTSQDSYHSKSFQWQGWEKYKIGLEMQSPWAKALIEGRKTIESRAYDLPPALMGKRIAIIESAKGEAGVSAMGDLIDLDKSSAAIIGWCTFESVKKYDSAQGFSQDEKAHLVTADSGYGWQPGKTKVIFGWVVGECHQTNGTDNPSTVAIRRFRSLFQLHHRHIDAKTAPKGQAKAWAAPIGHKKKQRRTENKSHSQISKKKRKRF